MHYDLAIKFNEGSPWEERREAEIKISRFGIAYQSPIVAREMASHISKFKAIDCVVVTCVSETTEAIYRDGKETK